MNMQYIGDHWAHIWAACTTAAIFCYAHGGIKGIALGIWRGKAEPAPTEPTNKN